MLWEEGKGRNTNKRHVVCLKLPLFIRKAVAFSEGLPCRLPRSSHQLRLEHMALPRVQKRVHLIAQIYASNQIEVLLGEGVSAHWRRNLEDVLHPYLFPLENFLRQSFF